MPLRLFRCGGCVCVRVCARARARASVWAADSDSGSESRIQEVTRKLTGPDVTVTSHTVSLREPKRLWALAMGMTRKIVPRERR
jgi:hypothetical protein